jgi:fatty-acyl-CoA synthase
MTMLSDGSTKAAALPAAPFAFTELTPTAFLERSAAVFPDRAAIIDGDKRFTYADFSRRSFALTGLLADLGVQPGDRVAALCANSHVMLELHHGVPLRGAVLVSLNIRLSAPELAYIVEHSGASVLVATAELAPRAVEVAATTGVRLVLEDEYERLLTDAKPRNVPIASERDLLAINYTSGTTGRPKGVMYHHRGAYLQALAMAFHTRLSVESRYLWTLPMFHCDGWCFTWAVAAAGGTHVCLRAVEPAEIWRLLRDEGVTHYSGAPTVLTMIAHAEGAAPLPRPVTVQTGGAPPAPTLLATMDALNMAVTHLYGLTETFGPLALNEWQPAWNSAPAQRRAALNARQGVGNVIANPVRVIDASGADVPADGETIGEIVARGNDVMLGYYRDRAATEEATVDGVWMRTGDLAVMHPDGYVEIRDRSKDIIITGGENVASVEVEQAIVSHPSVMEAAVVGQPDPKWGQIPVAYVTVRPGVTADEGLAGEIVAHVRSRLAGFKTPRRVVFGDLPKTSTGKIRKAELRAAAAGE